MQDLAVKTPWGLITAQYDLYATGRRLQQHQGQAGCRRLAGSSSDPLARAARKLMQGAASAAVPANGAAAPGLALPPNSSIPENYDADLTKLGAHPGAAARVAIRVPVCLGCAVADGGICPPEASWHGLGCRTAR